MSKEQYSKLVQLRDEMRDEMRIEMGDEIRIEDHFDLARVDGSFPNVKPESEPFPEYPWGLFAYELHTILESKIFQDGQFKGKQLTGHAKRYRSYQIDDLEKFIWLICGKIHDFTPIDVDQSIIDSLLNLLECIEECNNNIRCLFGKIQGDKIAAFGERVRTHLSTMMESSKKSSQQFLFTERDLTEQIFDLFKNHIPDAPQETISVGVCNFLELFHINCKSKTLTMRDYRKRKALPNK